MLVYKTYQKCVVLLTVFLSAVVSFPVSVPHTRLAARYVDAEGSKNEGVLYTQQPRSESRAELVLPYNLQKLSQGATRKDNYISPFAYRKIFKIRFPLKPRLFKHIHYLQKKNSAAKRDTKHSSYLQRKHVPFIKSFNMLLGDVLNVSKDISSEEREESSTTLPENEPHNMDNKNLPCLEPKSEGFIKYENKNCNKNEGKYYSKTNKKTTDITDTKFKITNDSESKTINISTTKDGSFDTTTGTTNFSKSILPKTNTTRYGGDDDRYTYGNSTTNNTDNKGGRSEYSGYTEHVSTNRAPRNISESFSEDSESSSRNSTDGGFTGPNRTRQRGNTINGLRLSKANAGTNKIHSSECITTLGDTFEQLTIENKVKDRTHTTEVNGERFGNRLRGYSGQTEKIHSQESIQPIRVTGNGLQGDSKADTDYQRNANRNCTIASNSRSLQKVSDVNLITSNSTIMSEHNEYVTDNPEINKPFYSVNSNEQVSEQQFYDITTVFPNLEEYDNRNETNSPTDNIFNSEV